MRRFLRNLLSDIRTTNKSRAARPAPRRASLSVEGLEDRLALSTASQVGSALLVTADPGFFSAQRPGLPIVAHFRSISFQVDHATSSKLDVLDGATLLGKFSIASVKSVNVSVAGLDRVSVDDTVVGLPFAAGTTVSLFGSGSLNSLTLSGTRTISGGETYVAGTGSQASLLKLGGVTFQLSSAIGSVTDLVKTTAPLFVSTSAGDPTLDGTNGVTQTLSGLGDAGGSLTYSNKNMVELDMFGNSATADLNATAAATGEQFFVVGLHGSSEDADINATPSTVTTSIVAAGSQADVLLRANAGRVSIAGTSSTLVEVGQVVTNVGFRTSFITGNVSVNGVGTLIVQNGGNHSTQEHVTVTESTISGTGLFGNNAVKLSYSNVASLEIVSGHLANTYSVLGSKPGATFGSKITIDDASDVGMSVFVGLDARSGMPELFLNNTIAAHPATASLFISAPGGKFSNPKPNLPAGIEDVTFTGGLTSEIVYNGFTSVTHS